MQAPDGKIDKAVAQYGPLAEIHSAENTETVWGGFLDFLKVGIENVFTPAPIQVNQDADIDLIQAVEQLTDWSVFPVTETFTQVIVHIDHREARAGNEGGFGN